MADIERSSDYDTPASGDWNPERFGQKRPACRHDFNALVAERDDLLAEVERLRQLLRDTLALWVPEQDEWTRHVRKELGDAG